MNRISFHYNGVGVHSARSKSYGLLGQGLLEIIIAMAVFAMIASALASLSIGGFRGLTQGGQRASAETFAQEGIEAVRAIRDRAWNENVSGPTGVRIQTNQWRFSGTQDVTPPPVYTRIIRLNPVCRNVSSVVVSCESGAITDIHSREVVVSVTWTTPYGATVTVEKRALITNWNSREWQENSTLDFTDGTFSPDTQASTLGDGASVTLREIIPGISYVTSGTYISNEFAASARAWNMLEWRQTDVSASCPSCLIRLQIQTSTNKVSWQSGWCGPIGPDFCNGASFYTIPSGTLIPTIHNNHRWIRYRATFEGSGTATPILEEVRINYQQ